MSKSRIETSKRETIRRDRERKAKYASVFDCASIDADYDCDVTRDYEAMNATLELRESVTRYAIAH